MINLLALILIILFPNMPQNSHDSNLSEEEALRIHQVASKHLLNIFEGGTCSFEDRRVPNDNNEYYYFCDNLDTEEKMYNYLEEGFTYNIANHLINELDIFKVNGRLAFTPRSSGSMNDWENARGEIVEEKNGTIVYKFTVPLVVKSDYPPTEVIIEYIYVEGKGWRINNIPSNFK
jgi:iseA protein